MCVYQDTMYTCVWGYIQYMCAVCVATMYTCMMLCKIRQTSIHILYSLVSPSGQKLTIHSPSVMYTCAWGYMRYMCVCVRLRFRYNTCACVQLWWTYVHEAMNDTCLLCVCQAAIYTCMRLCMIKLCCVCEAAMHTCVKYNTSVCVRLQCTHVLEATWYMCVCVLGYDV